MLLLELADQFVRGDDEVIAFQFLRADDTPEDLSDRTYRSSLKARLSDSTPAATFAVSVDLEAGSVILDMDRAVVAALPVRPYYWLDLEETVLDGDRTTIIRAKVPFLLDVTQ